MTARREAAFTLVELLVVIVVLGLLLALLMPGFSAVWQGAWATRCRHNLKTMWDAQGTWRAENRSSLLLGGSGWMAELAPYVEYDMSVFTCPAGAALTGSGSAGSGSSGSQGGSPVPADSQMEFYIYWREPQDSANRGALQYVIPLDGPVWITPGQKESRATVGPWVRKTNMGAYVLYEIDDEGYSGQGSVPTYDDILLEVHGGEGTSATIKILPGLCGFSPAKKYIYDFVINDKVVMEFWQNHYGEEIKLGGLAVGDYGVSKGTYETAAGPVTAVDGRNFYILDYHHPVADYNGDGGEDNWDKFFILDPAAWEKNYGKQVSEGETWQNYQVLRHFGQANMLFCDGHVTAVAAEELYQTSPFWR